jgi:membrane protein
MATFAAVPVRWRRPLTIARATFDAARADGVALGAGGCAFFATLALFPAMSILIAAYGLLFNPRTIEPQLQVLRELVPEDGYVLIARWIHHLVIQSHRSLGIGIGVSTLITVISATGGTRALLGTLAATHGISGRGTKRPGGAVRQHILSFAFTSMSIIVAVLGIALLTLMPIVIAMLGLRRQIMPLTHVLGTTLLIGCAGAFLIALYRLSLPGHVEGTGPLRRHAVPGAILATALWLIASSVLSFYADHIAQLGLTYGPVGAVIGLMLWLYVSFYAVLIGAELNAQLDRASPGGPRHGDCATGEVGPAR